MITAIGAKFLAEARLCGITIPIGEVGDITGTPNTQIVAPAAIDYTRYRASANTGGVILAYGAGDTPESVSDGALASPLGYFTTNATGDFSGGKYVVTATATNTTGSAFTVNEIGLLAEMNTSVGQSFLLARQVVPPRLVAAGETFTYSIAINFAGAH